MTSSLNLCQLQDVQDWLDIDSPNARDTRVLNRMISDVSSQILDILQRPNIRSATYTQTVDGRDHRSSYLSNWPVTSVASVFVGGLSIPASPYLNGYPEGPGWVLEPWDGAPPGGPQAVNLIGECVYRRGRGNVVITYTAGYLVSGEAQTVPSLGYQVAVSAPTGPWAADAGVSYASTGAALTLVSSAPTVGQYALVPSQPGVYQFSAADAGAAVLMSYSFTPAALQDACINLVSERFKYRKRIGMRSQSIGDGQTVSYDIKAVADYIKSALQPYCRTLPL